ncbi:MAG TPA: hypothetical protein PKW55_00475 [Spirochaetota bacterium]|mgnify:CR=1 FL=1|nr:hypothetical protein [Spirochaetota bacterium]HOM37830.1 hypothetical protein [Spirochaetota bacterium]HPQ49293.1 hypothetical protein [Spirochaetota bacterium]
MQNSSKIKAVFLLAVLIIITGLIIYFSSSNNVATDGHIKDISLIDLNREIINTQKVVVDTKNIIESVNSKINFMIFLTILNIIISSIVIFFTIIKRREKDINNKNVEKNIS